MWSLRLWPSGSALGKEHGLGLGVPECLVGALEMFVLVEFGIPHGVGLFGGLADVCVKVFLCGGDVFEAGSSGEVVLLLVVCGSVEGIEKVCLLRYLFVESLGLVFQEVVVESCEGPTVFAGGFVVVEDSETVEVVVVRSDGSLEVYGMLVRLWLESVVSSDFGLVTIMVAEDYFAVPKLGTTLLLRELHEFCISKINGVIDHLIEFSHIVKEKEFVELQCSVLKRGGL